MKIYGLLGKGISYSLSPLMHNAAFSSLGIDAEYRLFDVLEGELDRFFAGLVSGKDVKGVNVTVPYKVEAMERLRKSPGHRLDRIAELTGALNTIRVDGGKLEGFNTDVQGFYDSLVEDTGFSKKDSTVFIAGAGGAGRAISIYLASAGLAKRVNIFDIDRQKMYCLQNFLDQSDPALKGRIFFVRGYEDVPLALAESDLVVNATALGTREGDPPPLDTDLLKQGTVVYDLVYARETELVRSSREKGLAASGGLGMLVNQAALSFKIWNMALFESGGGKQAELFDGIKKTMREAALAGLKG